MAKNYDRNFDVIAYAIDKGTDYMNDILNDIVWFDFDD